MAFKMNVPLPGGITHNNGYVRVTDCRVCKKDDEDAEWFMMVDVVVYKDADARGAARPERISAPAVDKFKFAYAVSDGASPADAYAKLKTLDLFADATDV